MTCQIITDGMRSSEHNMRMETKWMSLTTGCTKNVLISTESLDN